MTILDAAVLGALQGLTEFLPVSSSGHLVLAGSVLDIPELSALFVAVVHVATLCAVLLYFRDSFVQLSTRDWFTLALSVIPVGLVGIFFHAAIDVLLSAPVFTAVGLLVTAGINMGLYMLQNKKKRQVESNLKRHLPVSRRQALVLGCFQAIAIVPGISRSGSTVLGGVISKLDIDDSFRFSFMMLVPAIVAGTGYELLMASQQGVLKGNETVLSLVVSGIVAGIVGYVSLKLLKKIVAHNVFHYFAGYCFVLALIVFFTVS